MKNLKILVDVTAIDKIYQGTAVYIFELYKAINQLDPNISLFFISNNKKKQEEYFSNFKGVTFLQFKSSNKFVQLYWELPKVLRQIEPDFAHFQYVIPLKSKVKYIVTIHDLLIFTHPHFFNKTFRIPRQLLYKYAINNANIITSVSDYTSQAIKHNFRLNNIVKTPNAVDHHSFDNLDVNDAKQYILSKYGVTKYILYVSRYEIRKNHKLLLDAFNELKLTEKGFSLVFIGSGLNEAYSVYKSQSFMTFEGVCKVDIDNFYKAAELFVYPSLAEGFGIPPLEALAANTRVVCSNATALKEFDFFRNRQFNPNNKAELKNQILLALETYSEEEISEQKKNAFVKYKWKNSAKQFLSALNQY